MLLIQFPLHSPGLLFFEAYFSLPLLNGGTIRRWLILGHRHSSLFLFFLLLFVFAFIYGRQFRLTSIPTCEYDHIFDRAAVITS